MTSPTPDHRPAEAPISPRAPRLLTILTVLGAASALWAIFLWQQLLAARAGADPFCGFGDSTDCGTLWSANFASANVTNVAKTSNAAFTTPSKFSRRTRYGRRFTAM